MNSRTIQGTNDGLDALRYEYACSKILKSTLDWLKEEYYANLDKQTCLS